MEASKHCENRSGEDGKFGHGDDSHDARRDPTESSVIAQPNIAKTPLQCEQLLHPALDTALFLGRADNVGLSKLWTRSVNEIMQIQLGRI